MAAPATSERKPSNRVDASRRHTMAITEDVLASLDTGTPPSQSQGISRHSRIESLRPLPPLPPPEEMLVNVGLGLLNTTLTSDSEEGTSSDTPSSAEPAVARRISLPPTITAPSLRTGTSDTASTQARRRVSAIVTSTSDSTTPAAQVLTGVRVDVATSRRVEHGRLSASGPPSAGLRARQGSTGTAGSRERIARLRAEWSALSAAEVESNGTRHGRFGPRSNSMYELKAPSATSARRASSATISDGSGSRRSSTASSLKPLKLEKAASHPTLRPLLNKPIPAPPRPTRSSARYCLRPTRDFSTQTPADWDQPQSPDTLTGGASVGERLRNHRRGSSWSNASHLTHGAFSPSDDLAPSLPPIPGHFSPSPSRYGAPSPSVYSVASFETTNRGWTRASQVSRHTMPLGIFEDLQQIDEAASSPIPDEAAATEILHGDDPFADYRILPSVTEMSRAPSVDADPASPPYPSSATPTPAARSSLVGDEDALHVHHHKGSRHSRSFDRRRRRPDPAQARQSFELVRARKRAFVRARISPYFGCLQYLLRFGGSRKAGTPRRATPARNRPRCANFRRGLPGEGPSTDDGSRRRRLACPTLSSPLLRDRQAHPATTASKWLERCRPSCERPLLLPRAGVDGRGAYRRTRSRLGAGRRLRRRERWREPARTANQRRERRGGVNLLTVSFKHVHIPFRSGTVMTCSNPLCLRSHVALT
jgi:hypothetical protein